MVKLLDPNVPSVRESLQDVVSVNIAELVEMYPCVSFHAATQKLAVSSLAGLVLVYDLRTAVRIYQLEVYLADLVFRACSYVFILAQRKASRQRTARRKHYSFLDTYFKLYDEYCVGVFARDT